MHVPTHTDLSRLSLDELKGLYLKVFNAAATARPNSATRRRAIEAREAIARELRARRPAP